MSSNFCCLICNLKLKTIFIRCIDCKKQNVNFENFYICLECFSQGFENNKHKYNHEYSVVNLNDVITFSNWTTKQELCLFEDSVLLNAQNWSEISKTINKRSKNEHDKKMDIECKDHFEDWLLILNHFEDTSSEINDVELFTCDSSYSLRENELCPPRPAVHTQQYRRLSGYRAARGDFETEFNNDYELKYICDIDYETSETHQSLHQTQQSLNEFECQSEIFDSGSFNSFELEQELKMSIIQSYRDLIKERYRRKEFIKNFGLLNELAINSMNNQYLLNKMQCVIPINFFSLFNNNKELMQYIELLKYENQIKKKLDELKEYRKNGLRMLKHAEIYKRLKTKRDNCSKSTYLSSILTTVIRFDANDRLNSENCKEWLKRFVLQEDDLVRNTNIAIPIRKHSPLKIENYPEWDKLNDEEKEFCRVSRIQPLVYLRVKQILVQEFNKVGYVTYTRARKIACIDVNKTRKIHNLLLNLKLIKANEST